MTWPASEGGGSVKNGVALDDMATSILAGSQKLGRERIGVTSSAEPKKKPRIGGGGAGHQSEQVWRKSPR
jgi:hypothetical protein